MLKTKDYKELAIDDEKRPSNMKEVLKEVGKQTGLEDEMLYRQFVNSQKVLLV